MWFIPTNSKALLAILNSKMGWWLITKFCTQIQGGYQLIWKYFGQIPVPDLPNDEKISNLAEARLFFTSKLYFSKERFLRRLQDNFEGMKITGALEQFDTMEFAEFLKELKKQKITLSLSQQDEWEEYFNQYKTDCNNLSSEIAATDNAIDFKVYKLYGLTYEEVLVVDKDTKITREEYEK